MPKHKHRNCPCGCGELADECMSPESALNAFSIGEAIPRLDSLDEYAASLTATAHPPSECADCAAHGEQYRTHFAKED